MHSRFTALEGYGEKEKEKLDSSTAAIVGLGATGSVMAEHLARHGVDLVLIDRDYLEENDLYSSNLYTREQVGKGVPKAEAAKERLQELTGIEAHVESLSGRNVDLLEDADIVLDGTDNLETRFLLDEYSARTGTPWMYTAAIAEKGYSMLFKEKCFSCVFEEVRAGSLGTCETEGIMREVSTLAATRSALKAVQHLSGKEVEEVLETVPPGEKLEVECPGCEVCEKGNYPHLEGEGKMEAVCGENKFQLEREVDEDTFERLRRAGEVVADNKYLTRVKVKGNSFALFRSGRAIIEARN
ncbi:MAG: ThiF family adenylyltransferase, partial [Candidatus Nanohaloarchaea archaeon]